MTAAVRLGLRLALGSARDQRLRAASVLVAVFVGAVVLLSTAAITHSQRVQQPFAYQEADNQRLLAAVIASILFPVLVLAATVGRLSAGLRDRRMANLRLLGMGRLSVRLVAAVETGAAAFAGALLGIPGFLAVRQPMSHVRVAGHGWPAPTLWPPAWTYVAVVLLLPAVVMAVAAVPQRLKMADALARARRADSRRPAWWRVVPLAIGVALCSYLIESHLSDADQASGGMIAVLFGGIILLGVGLILVVPVFVRLVADLTMRVTRRPTFTIAARRLQAQPAGVSRVISGLLIGLFLVVGARSVVVAFESTPQYETADRQIHGQQVVTVEASPHDLADQVRLARHTEGVRRVVSFARLSSSCRGTDPCVNALVGTCAELHAVSPALRGCREGRPFALLDLAQYGIAPGSPLPGLRAVNRAGGHRPSSPVVLTAPARPTHPWSGADEQALQALSADLIVPPDAPGVRELASTSQSMLVAIGAPGRDLADRLAAAGVDVSSGADFDTYDFVARLRALVWSIAAVILSIGLLAFAVAAVDRAVNRRREVTALQVVGVPRSVLRRTQWVEAAVPLALGCCLAIGLGLLAGETYLSLDSASRPGPWAQALVLAGLATLGSALVGGLTVIASSPRISADLIRQE